MIVLGSLLLRNLTFHFTVVYNNLLPFKLVYITAVLLVWEGRGRETQKGRFSVSLAQGYYCLGALAPVALVANHYNVAIRL